MLEVLLSRKNNSALQADLEELTSGWDSNKGSFNMTTRKTSVSASLIPKSILNL